jgi:hypothetical protein
MIQKYKSLIIAVVVIIGGFYAYNQFFNLSTQPSASLQVTNSADVLGADIIKAINQINALKLDRSVFEDPIFKTLVDRSEEIQPQSKSRPNPFAPITNIDFTVTNTDNTELNFDTETEQATDSDTSSESGTENQTDSEIPSSL